MQQRVQQRRIKRDYRQLTKSPAKFLPFCRKVKRSLTENPKYPDAMWGSNLPLRNQYFDSVDNLEVSFHLASNGDRLMIRNRDKLIQETTLLLDGIASFLELTSIRDPDALFTSGFTVTQQRKTPHRIKLALVAPADFSVENTGLTGRALATASTMPGMINQEIHINRKDPSVEQDWFHHAIFPNAGHMMMENLDPGNTFFRMRHHGPDGPGPWSPVVSTMIT